MWWTDVIKHVALHVCSLHRCLYFPCTPHRRFPMPTNLLPQPSLQYPLLTTFIHPLSPPPNSISPPPFQPTLFASPTVLPLRRPLLRTLRSSFTFPHNIKHPTLTQPTLFVASSILFGTPFDPRVSLVLLVTVWWKLWFFIWAKHATTLSRLNIFQEFFFFFLSLFKYI